MPIVSKMQVVIAGCGPAGLFAATACAELGLQTLIVSPSPRDHWPQRICVWKDEWPEELQNCLAQEWEKPRVIITDDAQRTLPRTYAQVDNDVLQTSLWQRYERAGGEVLDGTVTQCCHDVKGTTLATSEGNIRTWVVIDATGRAQRLADSIAPPERFQTAVGEQHMMVSDLLTGPAFYIHCHSTAIACL